MVLMLTPTRRIAALASRASTTGISARGDHDRRYSADTNPPGSQRRRGGQQAMAPNRRPIASGGAETLCLDASVAARKLRLPVNRTVGRPSSWRRRSCASHRPALLRWAMCMHIQAMSASRFCWRGPNVREGPIAPLNTRQQFDRFRSEADIEPDFKSTGPNVRMRVSARTNTHEDVRLRTPSAHFGAPRFGLTRVLPIRTGAITLYDGLSNRSAALDRPQNVSSYRSDIAVIEGTRVW